MSKPAEIEAQDDQRPAITRLVEHVGGPVAVSRMLGLDPAYQEVQRWVRRGYASAAHYMRLVPLMPPGMSIDDLYADLAAKRPRAAPSPASSDSAEAA